MNRARLPRVAAHTVLIVGEGDAEELFVRYLKGLYVARGSGVAVTVKNARGKGASHVVDYARRQATNAQYDVVASLLDTDTGWTDAARKMAKRASIHVLPCDPCLEALLLSIKDEVTAGKTTDQLKRAFDRRFGCSASEIDWARHLDIELINRKARANPILMQLIQLLTRTDVLQ